jgi:hypothetical protein
LRIATPRLGQLEAGSGCPPDHADLSFSDAGMEAWEIRFPVDDFDSLLVRLEARIGP